MSSTGGGREGGREGEKGKGGGEKGERGEGRGAGKGGGRGEQRDGEAWCDDLLSYKETFLWVLCIQSAVLIYHTPKHHDVDKNWSKAGSRPN